MDDLPAADIDPHMTGVAEDVSGLCFSKTAQIEYAAAEIKLRYSISRKDSGVKCGILPPPSMPISIKTIPPKKNCQPLSKTGFSPFESFFMLADENPLATVQSRIMPSPIKLKRRPPSNPLRLMRTIPAKPITEPVSLRAVIFSR